MEITKRIVQIALKIGLLLLLIIAFRQPHKNFLESKDEYLYAVGNAPEIVRAEILAQLDKFQAGYSRRDLDQVDSFMEELFSKENILVIGTMPDEIYIGPRDVSKLIYADWNAWGDCTFLIDRAHISSAEDVAWFATIGYVKFDVPRFLVLPLRLSGVMVKEGLGWKFQFVQFQFDLTLIPVLLTGVLLTVWLAVNLVSLILYLINRNRLKMEGETER